MQPRTIWVVALVLCISSLGRVPATMAQDREAPIFEGFPDHIQARLESRSRALRAVARDAAGDRLEYLVLTTRVWKPGQTVRVAFRGGDAKLHRDIAGVAEQWLKHGNLKLDFGLNQATGAYRPWSPSDTDFAAEIRISFDPGGFWSLVGRDSNDRQVASPGQASMNFAGFVEERPANWAAVVLHEFGHAFGFEHEHQHPTMGCDAEFKWENDPGYVPTTDSREAYIADSQNRKPGIYTVLSGFPNFWSESKVNFNLKQLTPSDAFDTGNFDRTSIMKYYFPAWMFRRGDQSQCYNGSQNVQISPEDAKGFARAYPREQADLDRALAQRRESLNKLLEAAALPAESKQSLQRRLETIDRP